jgi:hypothetical protein
LLCGWKKKKIVKLFPIQWTCSMIFCLFSSEIIAFLIIASNQHQILSY